MKLELHDDQIFVDADEEVSNITAVKMSHFLYFISMSSIYVNITGQN